MRKTRAAVLLVGILGALAWWNWQVPQADATYIPAIPSPGWPAGEGPAVLIDDAHWNGATGERGLAGFTTLLRADGYRLLPAGNATRAEMLADARIAVVADPLGLSGWLRGLADRLGLPPVTALDDDALWVQEMETVVQWVENGGSLLIAVDDGPPARGVRGLAVRLGIDLHEGVIVDLGHSEPLSPDRLVFSRENGLLGAHPIVDGSPTAPAVNRVVSVGGTALTPPAGADVLLRLSPSAVEVRPPRRLAGRGQAGAGTGPGRRLHPWPRPGRRSSPTPRWSRRCSTPTARRSGWARRGPTTIASPAT